MHYEQAVVRVFGWLPQTNLVLKLSAWYNQSPFKNLDLSIRTSSLTIIGGLHRVWPEVNASVD